MSRRPGRVHAGLVTSSERRGLTADRVEYLEKSKAEALAREFRYVIADMICRAAGGHLGAR